MLGGYTDTITPIYSCKLINFLHECGENVFLGLRSVKEIAKYIPLSSLVVAMGSLRITQTYWYRDCGDKELIFTDQSLPKQVR